MNSVTEKPVNVLHHPLKVHITIELHCDQAQRLFHGQWKHGQNGLTQFSKFMSILWHAAKDGDPYAEWYFFKTRDQIYAVKEEFKKLESYLDERLQKIRGIDISIYTNDQPLKKALYGAPPFGFMTAQLLVDFDYIIRKALTLKKLGIHLKSEHYNNPHLISTLRRLFGFPSTWHRTQVTREDIITKNEKAQKAIRLMGELPDAILNQKINFPFKPN